MLHKYLPDTGLPNDASNLCCGGRHCWEVGRSGWRSLVRKTNPSRRRNRHQQHDQSQCAADWNSCQAAHPIGSPTQAYCEQHSGKNDEIDL